MAEQQNTDAVDSDLEMMGGDAPETEKDPADYPGKKKYIGPESSKGSVHLDKKTDEYCAQYFISLLDFAVSRQFLSSYGNQIKLNVWPAKYIRELNKSLLFTGKKYNDAARLQAFLTMVLETALQVKTDNPQWFPKTAQQVIILDDLVAYLRALHNEVRCKPINAGGLRVPFYVQAFLIYETIEYTIIDRQGFLTNNCAITDMAVPGSLKEPTKKQVALFSVIEDWKASFPGDKFLLSDLLETAIDPSMLFDVTFRPRNAPDEGDAGDADEYDDDEDMEL